MSVTPKVFIASMARSEQMSKVGNTPPRKINLLDIPVLIFSIKKFSIIPWLHEIRKEMPLIETQRGEALEYDLMLNQIQNPLGHTQEVSGIMIKLKGDPHQFTQGIAKNGQTQMKKLVGEGFGYPVSPQLKFYLRGF